MKNTLIALALIFASPLAFAHAPFFCQLPNSEYSKPGTIITLSLKQNLSSISIALKQGELHYELESLTTKLNLVTKGRLKNGWETATYETNNSDDSNILVSIITNKERDMLRLSVHVLVDGLDGGTYAHGLECYQDVLF